MGKKIQSLFPGVFSGLEMTGWFQLTSTVVILYTMRLLHKKVLFEQMIETDF